MRLGLACLHFLESFLDVIARAVEIGQLLITALELVSVLLELPFDVEELEEHVIELNIALFSHERVETLGLFLLFLVLFLLGRDTLSLLEVENSVLLRLDLLVKQTIVVLLQLIGPGNLLDERRQLLGRLGGNALYVSLHVELIKKLKKKGF